MRTKSPIARFRNAVATACGAVGVPDSAILTSANGIAIPEAGITVSVVVTDTGRFWRATQRFVVQSLDEDASREYSATLFEEALDREVNVARRIAMRIAENRIDAAIDAGAA